MSYDRLSISIFRIISLDYQILRNLLVFYSFNSIGTVSDSIYEGCLFIVFVIINVFMTILAFIIDDRLKLSDRLLIANT